ncbi:MAG: phosphatase [Candidatus Saganbacteria bacterium]|nr:phosphatase [Candidatus Saganbacteria bacterium]
MNIIADLHLHTVSSGHAYSTIEEYVAQAKKIGLMAIGISDHGPAMPGAPHAYYFSNMGMIPKMMDGIRVYRGIEANVMNDRGELDLSDHDLSRLDFVTAAMHPLCGYENQGEEKNTQVLEKALENPHINIIAHPGNPKYPINIEKTVSMAKEKGVIIEINNSSFVYSRAGSWERCLAFAKEVKRQGWKVILSTDSHISPMLVNFDKAIELVAAAGLSDEDVVNTSLEKIEKYVLKR